MVARFEPGAIALQLVRRQTRTAMSGHLVRLEFADADPECRLVGFGDRAGQHNYLVGDKKDWRTNVPVYRQILYRGVHEGTDIRIRESGGELEYDVLLQPGAEVEQLRIVCRGTEKIEVAGDGSLILDTGNGMLVQRPPKTWQVRADGRNLPVTCRYRKVAENAFGFELADVDPELPVVIDPVLVWSTFVGTTSHEYANDIAVTADGSTFITGYVVTPAFPTTPGAFDTTFNFAVDAFVTKLDAKGAKLVYSTFYGGALCDEAFHIAVTAKGEATVLGFTTSFALPLSVRAYQRVNRGGWGELFLFRLNVQGSGLVFGTFLGGTDYDWPGDVAVDGSDNTTVVGWTKSTNFPTTTGAYSRTYKNKGDGFVTRFDASGSRLLFSTYLGSNGWDELHAVRVDSRGVSTIVGTVWEDTTGNSNFPTTRGAYDTTFNGKADAFIARFDSQGRTLLLSTFVGGSSWDYGLGLVLDGSGGIVLGGRTWSTDFPTTSGALDRTFGGRHDAYVTRLSASGGSLADSTYLGGKDVDYINELGVGPAGSIIAAGHTVSTDFPTTSNALRTNYGGGTADGFLSQLNQSWRSLDYSTYLGGSGFDSVYGLAVLGSEATVTGETFSANYPATSGVYDNTWNGKGDALVTRISFGGKHTHGTFTSYGRGCPGTRNKVPLHYGTGHPDVGQTISWSLSAALPNTAAVLMLGVVRTNLDLGPFGMKGCTWLVVPLATQPLITSGSGTADLPIPLPQDSNLIGLTLVTQEAVFDPGAPTDVKFVWSNGLETALGGTR